MSTSSDEKNGGLKAADPSLPPIRVRAKRIGGFLAAALSLPLSLDALAAETRLADVEFACPAGVPLALDAYIPDGLGPHPAAIIIHGGGWTGGDKRQGVPNLFPSLERAGYAWFSVNYRLGGAVHPFPACVEDSEAAIRWIRAHAAAHRTDPARLALIGPSAGGHLVSLLGTRTAPDLRVRAVVSFFGVHDTLAYHREHPPAFPKAFGLESLTDAHLKILRANSPSEFVRATLPPYLLIHGDADKLVDHSQSVNFQKQLRAAGVPCELITMPGRGHGLPGSNLPDAPYAAMIAWLDRLLKP